MISVSFICWTLFLRIESKYLLNIPLACSIKSLKTKFKILIFHVFKSNKTILLTKKLSYCLQKKQR